MNSPTRVSSINPYSQRPIQAYSLHSDSDLDLILKEISKNQLLLAHASISQRIVFLKQIEKLLLQHKENYASLITQEMGKPIRQSRAEIDKCAWLCRYYIEKAPDHLREEFIDTNAVKSYVRKDPLGIVLAIMPWNFPFWQVFRCAIPALVAGNAVLLKHASNVFGCALALEELFDNTGFVNCFKSLIIGSDKVGKVIQNQHVNAISITGSEGAGKSVASLAGRYLKPLVLELGGSNSFIVDESAQLEKIIPLAIQSRFQNNGQSCIASKRFLIHQELAEEFTDRFIKAISDLQVGDPFIESTDIGPLAKPEFNDELMSQMNQSVSMGARILCGGKLNHEGIFLPTVLGGVKPGMPAFSEETFGPLAAITTYTNMEEAIQLHESTRFGLGVNIFTEKIDHWLPHLGKISDGAVFFNDIVKSDPRLPFGGTKDSGYGRELSKDGLMEFVNRKTVYIA